MHLDSIYLVVSNFEKSIRFYEKVLQIPVTARNTDRFAIFNFEGHCIALMNGFFDADNPDKVERKGDYSDYFDDMVAMALAPNTHKFVLNFWDEDLRAEYERIKNLGVSGNVTGIKYVCHVNPYYFFQFDDPDGNIIEVTGNYTPCDNDF